MTKPISSLRQRMIDDMTIRNMSKSTQDAYIRAVAKFSAFHRQSPNRLGVEHLRNYQLHLVARGFGNYVDFSTVRRRDQNHLGRRTILKALSARPDSY